jgi:hypothetical protein
MIPILVTVKADLRYKVKDSKGRKASYRMKDMMGEVIEDMPNTNQSRVKFHVGGEILVGDFDNEHLIFN